MKKVLGISLSAVSEIMSSNEVDTADIKDSANALDVANLVETKVGSVVMVDGTKPIGIVTERDVLKKVSTKNKRAQEVPAKEVMSSPPVTIKAIDSIDTAAEIMVKTELGDWLCSKKMGAWQVCAIDERYFEKVGKNIDK